jgi:hypothetical protein
MEAIIVNLNRIYGSIGLYIPLSLNFRNNLFHFHQIIALYIVKKLLVKNYILIV